MYYDIFTVVHEFGHFNSVYHDDTPALYTNINMDVSEIHSQGLELLFYPYYEQMYPGMGSAMQFYAVYEMFNHILLSCAFDEVENAVYRNPDLTPVSYTHLPLEILAYQYDIVCNGVELSSGAVRNHNLDIMIKAFEIAGYTEEDLKQKFGALYNAFQFGAPPHAGMAPGVDRMIMLLRNEENIREIIPFPMNGNAQDLMCGAPGEVTETQLREVHIKVRQ